MQEPILGPWDFDVHTVARGVSECNMLMAQGWRVYHAWIVPQEVRRHTGQAPAQVEPWPYYMMGRRLADDESRATAVEHAVRVSDDALAIVQPAQPDESIDPAAEGEATGQPEPPALPARPRQPARQVGSRTREGLEVQGIR